VILGHRFVNLVVLVHLHWLALVALNALIVLLGSTNRWVVKQRA
jgi:hypothetical protein